MTALGVALDMTVYIRRHLRGYRGIQTWTPESYREGITRIQHRWRTRCHHIGRTDEERAEFVAIAGDWSVDRWSEVSYEQALSVIDDILILIRNKMHGRARSDLRRQINDAVQRREESVRRGAIGKPINSMLGKHRIPVTLERLELKDDSLFDQREIHATVTEFFRDWFADGDRVDRYGHWKEYEESFPLYKERHKASNVPEDLLRIIWTAMQKKARPSERLKSTPTWEEFESAIGAAKTDSAPGVSGLSYNQIKA
jgi:hypothetical protein